MQPFDRSNLIKSAYKMDPFLPYDDTLKQKKKNHWIQRLCSPFCSPFYAHLHDLSDADVDIVI